MFSEHIGSKIVSSVGWRAIQTEPNIIIIIMVIFKCYFSGQLVALS